MIDFKSKTHGLVAGIGGSTSGILPKPMIKYINKPKIVILTKNIILTIIFCEIFIDFLLNFNK